MKKTVFIILSSFALHANADFVISEDDSNQINQALDSVLTPARQEDGFVVIEESASERFVQFTPKMGKLSFDFPIYSATAKNYTYENMPCIPSKLNSKPDDVIEYLMKPEEVERLEQVLNQQHIAWKKTYCTMTKNHKRYGYFMSYSGELNKQTNRVEFVQSIFRDVYLLDLLDTLNIETEE